MEASELRQFSVEELKSRIRQWREEGFRSKFKNETNESRDTSTVKKTRRDIARGLTVLNEKLRAGGKETAVVAKPVETKAASEVVVEDKPVKAKKKTTKSEKGKE